MNSRSTWKTVVDRSCRAVLVVIALLLAISKPSAISNSSAISSLSSVSNHLNVSSGVGSAVQRTTAGGRTAAVVKESSGSAIAVTAVRNLGEEAWLERLEIEVKNLTSKRVFCLLILVVFPDLKRTGPDGVPHPQVILLTYGRRDLLRDGNVATADDIPIKPDESYVFRIPESDRKKLESDLAAGIVPESAVKRFVISVDSVSFGDGTGFSSGKPFSTNKRSSVQGPLGTPPRRSDHPAFGDAQAPKAAADWRQRATRKPPGVQSVTLRTVSFGRGLQYTCGAPLSNCWKYEEVLDMATCFGIEQKYAMFGERKLGDGHTTYSWWAHGKVRLIRWPVCCLLGAMTTKGSRDG